MKKLQTGFTLVEIAIVLLIVGLLLGGVLKGQELIDSAKAKNLAQDLRSIPAMAGTKARMAPTKRAIRMPLMPCLRNTSSPRSSNCG